MANEEPIASPVVETQYAPGPIRDRFLASLDEGDRERTIAAALQLVACHNPLPSATCAMLGLPGGSSYGAGARAILAGADNAT